MTPLPTVPFADLPIGARFNMSRYRETAVLADLDRRGVHVYEKTAAGKYRRQGHGAGGWGTWGRLGEKARVWPL